MSKGVYTIIDSFVGIHDAALTATELLIERLKKIHKKNIESQKYPSIEAARPKLLDVLETHNFFTKTTYKPYVAFAHEYFKKNIGGGSSRTVERGIKQTMRFNLLGNNGDFIHDMVVRIVLEGVGGTDSSIRYRYCDFPGIRLFNKVEFLVDANPIDQYDSIDAIQFFRTRLASEKTQGFADLVGQQDIKQGKYYNQDYSIIQLLQFTDGAQTPRPSQPELELFIPIVFDFNLDIRRSLHTAVITSQQVDIVITLESLERILQALNPDGTIHVNQPQSLRIKHSEIYTKNIYYPAEINDIFNMANNYAIIRIRKSQKTPIKSKDGSILMDQLKYPIEFINFGFRPDENDDITANPVNSFTDWYKLAIIDRVEFPIPVLVNNPVVSPVQQLVARTASYTTCTPTITKATVKIHGNILYDSFTEKFYSSYLQWVYPNVNTAGECGFYVISFANDPNMIDPNGHVNNSTAREIYLDYSLSDGSTGKKITLFVTAQCINILMYSRGVDGKGTIKLKYIT